MGVLATAHVVRVAKSRVHTPRVVVARVRLRVRIAAPVTVPAAGTTLTGSASRLPVPVPLRATGRSALRGRGLSTRNRRLDFNLFWGPEGRGAKKGERGGDSTSALALL